MGVRRLDDPAAFLAAVAPLIAPDEARHNLMFGLLATLRDHPGAYATHHLWLVEHGGRPVGAALQTPPYNLVLARPAHDGALAALAAAIHAAGIDLPGVSGAQPEAAAFAAEWVGVAGGSWHTRMGQGIYLLRQPRPVPRAAGAPRLAGPADAPIVARLVADFTAEATPEERPADPAAVERAVATRLGSSPERAGFWLWEDCGAVVALTGHGGPTPNGIRIGPVYTPPAQRGRGYATSLVAEQSAWLLANGRRFCFLYTNLANPTSNGIYRRIGYEQVAEAAEIGFAPHVSSR